MPARSSSDSTSDSSSTAAPSALDRIRVVSFLAFFAAAFLLGVLVLAVTPSLPSYVLGVGIVVLSVGGWLAHLVWNLGLRLPALLGRFPVTVGSWMLVLAGAAGLYLLGQFELNVIVPFLETHAPEWADYYAMGASGSGSRPSFFQIGASVLILPILEEILFRGVVFSRWRHAWEAPWLSVGATSGFFMLLHGHFLSSFVFSVVAILLYVSTRSLWAPIAMHILLNGTAAIGGLSTKSWFRALTGTNSDTVFGTAALVVALVATGVVLTQTRSDLHAPLPYLTYDTARP